jgi:hypothetical protein
MKIKVLYEDQLSNAQVLNYGPHKFLLNCLFDRTDVKAKYPEMYLLGREVEPLPCKGNANVKVQLEKNLAAFDYSQIAPIVCLDMDRAYRLFNLSSSACKLAIKDQFWNGLNVPLVSGFVLLDRNLEDVLKWSRKNGADFTDAQFKSAVEDKNLQDRDTLLLKAARDQNVRRSLAVGDAMPSFRRLVEKTAAILLT